MSVSSFTMFQSAYLLSAFARTSRSKLHEQTWLNDFQCAIASFEMLHILSESPKFADILGKQELS